MVRRYRQGSAQRGELIGNNSFGGAPLDGQFLKAVRGQSGPAELQPEKLTVKKFYLLVDSADGRLDVCVCRPYLVTFYAELSHADSFGSNVFPLLPNLENCGELGNREGDPESGSSACGLVGDNLAFVSLYNRADDRKAETRTTGLSVS